MNVNREVESLTWSAFKHTFGIEQEEYMIHDHVLTIDTYVFAHHRRAYELSMVDRVLEDQTFSQSLCGWSDIVLTFKDDSNTIVRLKNIDSRDGRTYHAIAAEIDHAKRRLVFGRA